MTPHLVPNFTAVPDSLKELDSWVLWRYITRDGKPTKVPFAISGSPASSTDSNTWCSFERALDAYRNGNFAGIGFVFSTSDPYIGIDLDKCLTETNTFKPWAQTIIERFADTYAEISPSGTGVKIWAKGKLPVPSGKKFIYDDGGIEMYDHARFFTVTAAVAPGAPSDIEDHQRDVDWLYSTLAGSQEPPSKRADLRTTDKVPSGSRHNFLMSMAAQFRTRGMERSEIIAALRAINAERCTPPKSDKEIADIVDWVAQKPAGVSRPSMMQPITTALCPAQANPNWRDHLIISNTGQAKPILANAITALKFAPEWAGVLGHDEFGMSTAALRETPWNTKPAKWSDHEDRLTAEWLQREGIFVTSANTREAVLTVARDRSFHPVRTYLSDLRWDGEPRIDHWLHAYLGAENNEYTRVVGARWLISAVARIFKPGCKVDYCLILEGKQGIRKSTAVRVLSDPWFTDDISDLGSKDAALQTHGIWIVEIAELDSMSRSDVARTKAFVTRQQDHFRPPYGSHTVDFPRHCVFAGTVNHSEYLKDETGGRRFWPVACVTIDVDALARDRDQLWAEAVARYQDGAIWWCDESNIQEITEEQQAARYESDPWQDLIKTWLANPSERRDRQFGSPDDLLESNSQSVTMNDILMHCLHKDRAFWTQLDKNRVSKCLRSIGWEKYRGGTGGRQWRYRSLE